MLFEKTGAKHNDGRNRFMLESGGITEAAARKQLEDRAKRYGFDIDPESVVISPYTSTENTGGKVTPTREVTRYFGKAEGYFNTLMAEQNAAVVICDSGASAGAAAKPGQTR